MRDYSERFLCRLALSQDHGRFTLHYNDDGTFKGVDLEVRATHFKGKMNQDKMSRRMSQAAHV